MDLKIAILEGTMEKLLNDSELPPTVKRLVLERLVTQMTAESNKAIQQQSKEEKEKDAESV